MTSTFTNQTTRPTLQHLAFPSRTRCDLGVDLASEKKHKKRSWDLRSSIIKFVKQKEMINSKVLCQQWSSPKILLHQSVEIMDSVLGFQVDSLKIANPTWVCVYIFGGPEFLKNMFRWNLVGLPQETDPIFKEFEHIFWGDVWMKAHHQCKGTLANSSFQRNIIY